MREDHREPRTETDPPRMPRWVKVSAIVVGVLILLFVLLQVTGLAGDHGPGRHLSGAGLPALSTGGAPPGALGFL